MPGGTFVLEVPATKIMPKTAPHLVWMAYMSTLQMTPGSSFRRMTAVMSCMHAHGDEHLGARVTPIKGNPGSSSRRMTA